MSRERLVYLCSAVVFVAGSNVDPSEPRVNTRVRCGRRMRGSRDAKGSGLIAAWVRRRRLGPKSTKRVSKMRKARLGCSCAAGAGPLSCFLPDTALGGGDVLCRERTRSCREGVGGCESVQLLRGRS